MTCCPVTALDFVWNSWWAKVLWAYSLQQVSNNCGFQEFTLLVTHVWIVLWHSYEKNGLLNTTLKRRAIMIMLLNYIATVEEIHWFYITVTRKITKIFHSQDFLGIKRMRTTVYTRHSTSKFERRGTSAIRKPYRNLTSETPRHSMGVRLARFVEDMEITTIKHNKHRDAKGANKFRSDIKTNVQ